MKAVCKLLNRGQTGCLRFPVRVTATRYNGMIRDWGRSTP